MSFKKRVTSAFVIATILISNCNFSFADSAKVVTLGTNLTQEQKDTMLKYFNVDKDEAIVFEVNNEQERQYLEGIIPDAQIGRKTYSCSYVEPTSSDKINVKTVNLTYVTSNTISSAVATATGGSIGGANIVVASPFKVSGTGGLVGVLLALEDATGEKLDEDKKELANEEMIVTGQLGEEIGAEQASGIINSIKTEIIKNNTSDTTQIAETINNVTNNYNITLNVEQKEKIEELMIKISEQDYNYKDMKNTLNNISKDINSKLDEMGIDIKTGILDTVKDWFSGFGEWFSNIFNSKKDDLGILENTKDELLGENVIIDATTKDAINLPSSEEIGGFFKRIWNWFTGLFKNNETNELENNLNTQEESLFEEEIIEESTSDLNVETEEVIPNEDIKENTIEDINSENNILSDENNNSDETNEDIVVDNLNNDVE